MVSTHLLRRRTAGLTRLQALSLPARASTPDRTQAVLRELAVVLHATQMVRQAMERERASCR